ncbi:MAG: ABC transporter ATP-binding protein [Candidatus Pristimantibacillus lignocellulolyticus]|uniref:ABC transporter ATP-binding protein n=1 Tax=Candidatus Pristimantibacillus lignocellulolyticus TaxID=2994561 RepID=A0A9J6Z8U8_9BACL|nr:MAG: ABC transporter ATP-binding protein [Candidatus Pristimantibacillus lignocellulolyticus]
MEKQAIVVADMKVMRDRFTLGPLQLSIPEGYVTAIVGPNGSGKSTLFNCLMNFMKPSKGNITIFDHQLGLENDDELKQRIGYVRELPSSYDAYMRGSDKAKFNSRWYRNWNETTYQGLLSLLNTRDDIPLKKMSKGTRRKFDLCLALSHQPDLLILDEPSSGLDPIAWKSMIETLHQYMESGNKTILMATHIVDEVKRLADYIIFQYNGKILGFYEKDELLRSWATYFVESSDKQLGDIRHVPGYVSHKNNSGQHLEVMISKAWEAEQWFLEKGIKVHTKQLLELDDILLQHINQVGHFSN